MRVGPSRSWRIGLAASVFVLGAAILVSYLFLELGTLGDCFAEPACVREVAAIDARARDWTQWHEIALVAVVVAAIAAARGGRIGAALLLAVSTASLVFTLASGAGLLTAPVLIVIAALAVTRWRNASRVVRVAAAPGR